MLRLHADDTPFYLTLAVRFTGLRIKQASRNSIMGQCLLIKPERVKERQADQEPEEIMVSCSVVPPFTCMKEQERERRESLPRKFIML